MSEQVTERPYPQKCFFCRERSVVRVTEPYETVMQHDGREYRIAFPELALRKCQECGERAAMPDESMDRLYHQLRIEAGILTPEEIRHGRVRLGMNEQELGDHLGFHHATVSRWERGGQLQSKPTDTLLRLFFAVPEARAWLANRKDSP